MGYIILQNESHLIFEITPDLIQMKKISLVLFSYSNTPLFCGARRTFASEILAGSKMRIDKTSVLILQFYPEKVPRKA